MYQFGLLEKPDQGRHLAGIFIVYIDADMRFDPLEKTTIDVFNNRVERTSLSDMRAPAIMNFRGAVDGDLHLEVGQRQEPIYCFLG